MSVLVILSLFLARDLRVHDKRQKDVPMAVPRYLAQLHAQRN